MKFGLPEETIIKINKVFAKYPEIEKVIIYGSRAKGNYRIGSDIDLTIMSINNAHLLLTKILNDLDELLLPYMIDLSFYIDISNENLKEHIKRVGQVFYEN